MFLYVVFVIIAASCNVVIARVRESVVINNGQLDMTALPDIVLDNIPDCPTEDVAKWNIIEDVLVITPLVLYIAAGCPLAPIVFTTMASAYVFRCLTLVSNTLPTPTPDVMVPHKNIYSSRTDITFSGHTIFSLTPLLGLLYANGYGAYAAIAAPAYLGHEVIKMYLRNHYTCDVITSIGMVLTPFLALNA